MYGYRPTTEGILSIYIDDEHNATVVRAPEPRAVAAYSHAALDAQVAAILHNETRKELGAGA